MSNWIEPDDKQHEHLYQEKVKSKLFTNQELVEEPKLLFVAAQPGAGKSSTIKLFKKLVFGDNEPLEFSTDKLRIFHPQAEEMKQTNDKEYGKLTHKAAKGWFQKALADATKDHDGKGFNLALEGTLRSSEKALKTFSDLKEAPQETVLIIRATNERESVMRLFKRYEGAKLKQGSGRLPETKYHNECYEALLKTVQLLEEAKVINHFILVDDHNKVLHYNQYGKNPGIAKGLVKEWSRVPSIERCLNYMRDWSTDVFKPMINRKAPEKEIQDVKNIANRYDKQLERDLPDRAADRSSESIKIEDPSGGLKIKINQNIDKNNLKQFKTVYLENEDLKINKTPTLERSSGVDRTKDIKVKAPGIEISMNKNIGLDKLKKMSQLCRSTSITLDKSQTVKLEALVKHVLTMDKSPDKSITKQPQIDKSIDRADPTKSPGLPGMDYQ